MLKIKDNVDLKELEKFGFKYYEYTSDDNKKEKGCYIVAYYDGWSMRIAKQEDAPNCDNLIELYADERENNLSEPMDILFYLIQAGLVEKVEAQDGSVGD